MPDTDFKKHIKAPVKYFSAGTMIIDSDLNHILDIRGWGRLQKLPDGPEIQDAIGEWIAKLINEDFNKC